MAAQDLYEAAAALVIDRGAGAAVCGDQALAPA
jgi:hypothetical protein